MGDKLDDGNALQKQREADARYVQDLRDRADRERARWEHDTLIRTNLETKHRFIRSAWLSFRAVADRWQRGETTNEIMGEAYEVYRRVLDGELTE